jgi:hypothetical protein
VDALKGLLAVNGVAAGKARIPLAAKFFHFVR